MCGVALGSAVSVAGFAPAYAEVPDAFSSGFFLTSTALVPLSIKIPNVGGITGWCLPGSDTCVKLSGYLTADCLAHPSASGCFYNYAWTYNRGPGALAVGASFGGAENFADAHVTWYFKVDGGTQSYVPLNLSGILGVGAIAGFAPGQDERAGSALTWNYTNQTGPHTNEVSEAVDATGPTGPLVTFQPFTTSFRPACLARSGRMPASAGTAGI
jgi:hypothetical protein